MASGDHYIFMDGCIVKGCRPFIDFEHTFGDYAAVLTELYHQGHWGGRAGRVWGFRQSATDAFEDWADKHIHVAQSTQNLRTGASRVDGILRSIRGDTNIHLFGTSAAGSAMLEYFLLCDPQTLYYHNSDKHGERMPTRRYRIDPRIASFTAIDAPANWVPVRRDRHNPRIAFGPGTVGRYLADHTRIQAGPRLPAGRHTTRMEDVPNTWVECWPVAGIDYDDRPHYDYLPEVGLKRHIYTGGHASHESRAFLERVWR